MALFSLGNLLNLAQSQPPDLSFGLSPDGTFSGSSAPSFSALSSTPSTGVFSGADGMNPMLLSALSKTLGGFGQQPAQQVPVQFGQYADPQAMLTAPMLGHALLTGGR